MTLPGKTRSNQPIEEIPDSDGAVRELEKAKAAHARAEEPQGDGSPREGTEVVPLAKYGSGAAEEAANSDSR